MIKMEHKNGRLIIKDQPLIFWYQKKENSEDITLEIRSFMKLRSNKSDDGDS
jgi:hypothetical protein